LATPELTVELPLQGLVLRLRHAGIAHAAQALAALVVMTDAAATDLTVSRWATFGVQKEKRSALVRAHASPKTAGLRQWRWQRSATASAVVEFSGKNSSGARRAPDQTCFRGPS